MYLTHDTPGDARARMVADPRTHHERHRDRVARAECSQVTLTTHQSDGSDGYERGAWYWMVSSGGWATPTQTYFEGGFASRDLARADARRRHPAAVEC